MDYTRREFLQTTGAAAAASGAGALSAAGATGASAAPKPGALCFTSARELAAMIRRRQVSAREVMVAHLAQINRVNPKLNAIVAKLDDAACLALADEADQRLARGDAVGPLHGLPTAIKDLEPTVGFPNTRGSPIYRFNMPKEDSLIVARIRAAGALLIGKTNVPEFGLGSHSYNKVYGTTLNPYDPSRSAGGSSGGAAVAVATGMLPLANGSDTGGSLRNPANFNNVVGFRPTPGLVPMTPTTLPYIGLGVKGPIARTVADTAFFLSVIAGQDGTDPGSWPSNPAQFLGPLERDLRGVRVAWSPDLGKLPLDARVRAVLDAQRKTFEALGCIVEDVAPDLTGADESFLTLRAFRAYPNLAPLVAAHRAEMKPEALREVDAGSRLTGAEVSAAMARQAELMERMRKFQERYEFVLCAVNQVPPFDANADWPKEISGVKMDHYISWMKSAYWITATHRPAISVPAGFTPEGLPVGIQIVGRYREDAEVLRCAHMFEQATKVGAKRPAIAG